LQNIKRLGYAPNFVFDIGAYEGDWAIEFSEVFPDSKIFMFEAQEEKENILQNVKKQYPNFDYHIGLLSAIDGKAYSFSKSETGSHVSHPHEAGSSTLTSESLDAIIERKSLPFPDFIKIDVQGFELEVMKGADKCLQHSEFCLLEVSLLDLGENTPLVLDTMNFMDKLNFQLYDINTFMRRPYDNALWQNDFLFVKKNSQFVASKRWV
jgi:FkbM family methyltransferase